MLRPVKDCPDLFQDTETAQVINTRDFHAFEVTTDMRKRWDSDSVKPRAGESWILDAWSVIIHPWHEVIPPSIEAELVINDLVLIKLPLFRVAEPVKRSKDYDLEVRLKRLEEKYGIVCDAQSGFGKFEYKRLINQNHEICMRLRGSADEMMPLFEMSKYLLFSLRGQRRAPAGSR